MKQLRVYAVHTYVAPRYMHTLPYIVSQKLSGQSSDSVGKSTRHWQRAGWKGMYRCCGRDALCVRQQVSSLSCAACPSCVQEKTRCQWYTRKIFNVTSPGAVLLCAKETKIALYVISFPLQCIREWGEMPKSSPQFGCVRPNTGQRIGWLHC